MKDLILIIGAGIGGLTSGALLAKKGWKVVIIEQSSRTGGCCGTFSADRFRFDTGPTVFPDFLCSGLDLIFRDLGLELERIFFDPFYQICLPGHRIGIYKSKKATEEEWSRELPELADEINTSLRRFSHIYDRVRYKFEKQSKAKALAYDEKGLKKTFLSFSFVRDYLSLKWLSRSNIISKTEQGRLFRAGIDLQTLFWGQKVFAETALNYAALIMGLPLNGGFQVRGGSSAICDSLSKFIKNQGGQIRLNSNVVEILQRKNQVIGLRLDNKEVLEGRCYIANTTPWTLYERLLPKGNKTEGMIRKMTRASYPRSVFTLFLGIKETCLPSQLGNKILFLPNLENEEPLFIDLNPLGDTSMAPEGYRTVRVFRYTSPMIWYKSKEEYISLKKKMEDNILQSLRKLIPFIQEGLCYSESATPVTYERFTSRPRGIVKGVPQVSAAFNNKVFSEFTSYPNLFMVGDCIPPGLGVEGICRVSLRLTDRICRRYD